jgi:hypothetical protein
MINKLKITAFILLGIWLVANASAMFVGLVGNQYEYTKPCSMPTTRIEYVVPGNRLGCCVGHLVRHFILNDNPRSLL